MRKRRLLLWLGLLLALAGAGIGVVSWFTSDGPISRLAYATIRKGMTQPEVEGILGGPPQCYLGDRDDYLEEEVLASSTDFNPLGDDELGPQIKSDLLWGGHRLGVEVYFDQEGKVMAKRLLVLHRKSDLLPRLRRWLGL